MNTPVSFETKQLLFDKGWRYELSTSYDPELGGIRVNHSLAEQRWNEGNLTYVDITISDVVMWLYKKHGIWIQAPFSHNDPKPFCWTINITKRNISEEDENRNCWLSGIDNNNVDGYNSPTEAYEAAITYTLNNLI